MKVLRFSGLFFAVAAVVFYLVMSPFPGAPARPSDSVKNLTDRDGRAIEYVTQGSGPNVVLLASAGRSVSDFNELAAAIVSAGYRTTAIEAPGIGGSDLPETPLSLFDLADDVVAVLEDENGGGGGTARAIIIGHAFGNRVARAASTKYSDQFHGVILIAAGGQRAVPEKAERALKNAFDPRRTAKQRRSDIAYAFFADGNKIPDYWRRGWYRHTAVMQGAAPGATASEHWQASGLAPILIVQADADRIAPKEDAADILLGAYGQRVEVVVIEKAGHALLPEQPDAIADAVLAFLQKVSPVSKN